jgi:hypothetical protein
VDGSDPGSGSNCPLAGTDIRVQILNPRRIQLSRSKIK